MPQTSDYGKVFIALAVLWIIQAILTFTQNKNISKEFSDIQRSNTGYLGIGFKKAKFNLGRGVILAIVVGFDGLVKDFRVLSGVSVLAKFKQFNDYIGLTIEQAKEKLKAEQHKRVIEAFEQAIEKINEEREKNKASD